MQNNQSLQVGIVFSGGMAKGSYEIGVMKAFQKQAKLQIAAISAASIGTLNAYAWLCGKISNAEQIWKSVYAETMGKSYRTLIKNRGIYDYIDIICKETDFLSAPLYTVCTSPSTFQPCYILLNELEYEKRKEFLKASITMFPVMPAHIINHVSYYDGAVMDNTPFLPLKEYEFDCVVVVQFDHYQSPEWVQQFSCPLFFLNPQKECKWKDSFRLEASVVTEMISCGFTAGEHLFSMLAAQERKKECLQILASQYNFKTEEKDFNGDRVIRKLNQLYQRKYKNKTGLF